MENAAATPPLDELKVRDRLLAVAARLFTERGYAATSVSEIVAAAGVTKPILYYYFKNKEGLYLEILHKAYGRLDDLLEQAGQWTGTATVRIQRFGAEIHRLFIENLDAARMIHAIYYGPPQGAPPYDYDAHLRRYLGALGGIVEEGLAGGEFKPELDAQDIALGAAGIIEISLDLELTDRGVRLDRERLMRLLGIYFGGVLRT